MISPFDGVVKNAMSPRGNPLAGGKDSPRDAIANNFNMGKMK